MRKFLAAIVVCLTVAGTTEAVSIQPTSYSPNLTQRMEFVPDYLNGTNGEWPFDNLIKSPTYWARSAAPQNVTPVEVDATGMPVYGAYAYGQSEYYFLSNLFIPTQFERPGNYVVSLTGLAEISLTNLSVGATTSSCTGVQHSLTYECDNTGCSAMTGSISGQTLTVAVAPTGTGCGLVLYQPISDTSGSIFVNKFGTPTMITGTSTSVSGGPATCGLSACTGAGGIGTYLVNFSQSVSSEATMIAGMRFQFSVDLDTSAYSNNIHINLLATGTGSTNYAQHLAVYHVNDSVGNDESVYASGKVASPKYVSTAGASGAKFSYIRDLKTANADAGQCTCWSTRTPANYVTNTNYLNPSTWAGNLATDTMTYVGWDPNAYGGQGAAEYAVNLSTITNYTWPPAGPGLAGYGTAPNWNNGGGVPADKQNVGVLFASPNGANALLVPSFTITGGSADGTTVTLTFATSPGLVAGNKFFVNSVTGLTGTYTGIQTAASGTSGTTVKFTNAASGTPTNGAITLAAWLMEISIDGGTTYYPVVGPSDQALQASQTGPTIGPVGGDIGLLIYDQEANAVVNNSTVTGAWIFNGSQGTTFYWPNCGSPEMFVELAYELGMDVWITADRTASDPLTDMYPQYAAYIATNYPTMHPTVEAINEIFNTGGSLDGSYLSVHALTYNVLDTAAQGQTMTQTGSVSGSNITMTTTLPSKLAYGDFVQDTTPGHTGNIPANCYVTALASPTITVSCTPASLTGDVLSFSAWPNGVIDGYPQMYNMQGKVASMLGQAFSKAYGGNGNRFDLTAGVQTGATPFITPPNDNYRMQSWSFVNQALAPQTGYLQVPASNYMTYLNVTSYWEPGEDGTQQLISDAYNYWQGNGCGATPTQANCLSNYIASTLNFYSTQPTTMTMDMAFWVGGNAQGNNCSTCAGWNSATNSFATSCGLGPTLAYLIANVPAFASATPCKIRGLIAYEGGYTTVNGGQFRSGTTPADATIPVTGATLASTCVLNTTVSFTGSVTSGTINGRLLVPILNVSGIQTSGGRIFIGATLGGNAVGTPTILGMGTASGTGSTNGTGNGTTGTYVLSAGASSFVSTAGVTASPLSGVAGMPVTITSLSSSVISGSYNSGTGVVTLTLAGSIAGGSDHTVTISSLTGTGANLSKANVVATPNSGSGGTTLEYTIAVGLTITTITGGTVTTSTQSASATDWSNAIGSYTIQASGLAPGAIPINLDCTSMGTLTSAVLTYTGSAQYINYMIFNSFLSPELATVTADFLSLASTTPGAPLRLSQFYLAQPGATSATTGGWGPFQSSVYGWQPLANCAVAAGSPTCGASFSGNVMTVTGTVVGEFAVGQTLLGSGLTGPSITPVTITVANGAGCGGTCIGTGQAGTYQLSSSALNGLGSRPVVGGVTNTAPQDLAAESTWNNAHSLGGAQVSANVLGMGINSPTSVTWPSFYFSAARIWNAQDGGVTVSWKDVEATSLGSTCSSYTWTHLDNIVAKYQAYGIPIIYTFGNVPNWANGSAGVAAPPSDLGGSGSANFDAFVTCVVARYGTQMMYEAWEEPSNASYWTGTAAQMQTMWANAYTAIHAACPTCTTLSPATSGAGGLSWLSTYLADGGGAYLDAVAMHCYQWASGGAPEFMANMTAYYGYAMANAGVTGYQPYCTEFNDGATSDPTFVAVSYIIGSSDLNSLVWYQYDNAANGYMEGANQGLNHGGIAYRVVGNWLNGGAWSTTPVRQANANGIRNTSWAGAVSGTPGTAPIYMTITNADSGHGISTQIIGTGVDTSGVSYIDLRVFGTATAGATGYVDFEMEANNQIIASTGQQWTMQVDVSATANITNGCPTTVSGGLGSLMQFETYTSGGSLVGNNNDGTGQTAFIPSSSNNPLNTLVYWSTAYLGGASVAYVRPALYFTYAVGTAIDCTYRLAVPSIDNGTVWVGNLTRNNGATSQVVWDSANGANGAVSYSTSYTYYGFWRDVGNEVHTVVGGAVPLTSSPIILDATAQAVWVP